MSRPSIVQSFHVGRSTCDKSNTMILTQPVCSPPGKSPLRAGSVDGRNRHTKTHPVFFAYIIAGFFGACVGFYAGLITCVSRHDCSKSRKNMILTDPVPTKIHSENLASNSSTQLQFPQSISNMFVHFATVPREDFTNHIDVGVPLDSTEEGSEEVLVLYTGKGSIPPKLNPADSKTQYGISAGKALQNCHSVKVILQQSQSRRGKKNQQCIAFVPQWESHHMYKYMRLGLNGTKNLPLDLSHPLRHVSAYHKIDGDDDVTRALLPTSGHSRQNYALLVDYLRNLDHLTNSVKSFLDDSRLTKGVSSSEKTVVVLTSNFGQSDMFRNFVCNARAKGLDLSNVVMFATDQATQKLSIELGIPAWYDETIYGKMPESAAGYYGDQIFSRIMLAKVYCVHLVLNSGYNVLFQDVDVVWHRNPLPYFESKDAKGWDMMFQDDGNRQDRYAPFCANTGFYFVRNNVKTQFFFALLLRMGDVISNSRSHQSVLIHLLDEFASNRGLRVKVWKSGETNKFPGGFEFHKRKQYMLDVLRGKKQPFIFHMSWTDGSKTKKKLLEQLGEWYLKNSSSGCHGLACCLPKANITCYYSDRPSRVPCNGSPTIDKNGRSFWLNDNRN